MKRLSVSRAARSIAKVYNVADYGAVGNGIDDDSPALQHAMQTCSDNGGGIMWFPPGMYMCRSSVYIRDGVTVDGVPGKSILTSDVDPKIQDDNGVPDNERMYGIFRSDQTHEINTGWCCRNLKFLGNVTEEPSVPQADRTRDPSPFHAIKINGSNCPETQDDFGQPTSGPFITNIVIENIEVQNMASLPITIFGVSGRNIVNRCLWRNCKDAGWVYNQEVICTNNHSINSNDNGFSLSRGNEKVICIGNTVENAALYGIWLSGYNEDIGPTEFTCTGNIVKNTGRSCINLDYGPSNGIVSDNILYQGYYRGPFDAVSDQADGISITGASGGVHATNLRIADNLIIAPARNGIAFRELDNSVIENNTIINPGTQYLADGTTAINAGNLANNNGICPTTAGSYSKVLIKNNHLIETRGTPYSNWAVSRANTSGVTSRGNEVIGSWRNTDNTLVINDRIPAGSPVVIQMAGGDGSNGGDVNPDVWWNHAGTGKLILRNADGSVLNLHSTSGTSSARSTMLMSAGSVTTYIGATSATRLDASSNSRFTVRVLSNGTLSSSDATAPLYVEGTASGPFTAVNSGLKFKRTAVSDTNYTAALADYIIAYTSLTATRTVTLPAAATAGSGRSYIFKDEANLAATHNIVIDGNGSEAIDGAASISITTNRGSLRVYSDGTNWHTC